MSTQNDLDTLWKIIKETKFCMLTHRHGDGHLHSQPLTTQNKRLEQDQTIYFFVPRDGDIVAHLAGDANVNLAYANLDDDDYASIAGTARVSEDMQKKEELFSLLNKAWFPQGATDPNLALLAVQITHAEYWKAKDGKVTQLMKMTAASMMGRPPSDMVEHGKI